MINEEFPCQDLGGRLGCTANMHHVSCAASKRYRAQMLAQRIIGLF